MAAENFKVKRGLEVGTGITANSDGINITGVVTATQLVGDGSGLTNVVGSGSGIVVKDEGSAVGTAGTVNFVGNGVVATLSAGQATVTIDGDSISEGNTKAEVSDSGTDGKFFVETEGTERFSIDSTGDFAFNNCSDSFFNAGGNLTIDYKTNDTIKLRKEIKSTAVNFVLFGAPLAIWNDNDAATTIEFHRGDRIQVGTGASISVNGNIFSAGIVTATQFVGTVVGTALSVVGVSTFSSVINANNGINLTNADNKSILLGESDDMRIRHTGSHSEITDEGQGSLRFGGDNVVIGSATFGVTMATFAQGGAVKLYHNDQQKLTTTGTGIEVPDLNVTGVGTIGQIETDGVTLGTNATTFAAKFPESARANFGSNNEFQISHASNISRIQSDNDILYLKGLGINFYKGGGSELFAKFVPDEQVEFYYNNGKRLETTGVGASCVGIMSATSFVKTGGTSSQFLMADGSTSTGGGGGGGVTVQDEGSSLSTTGTTLNFVGSGVVASGTGATKTITIAGGSSQNVFSTIAVSGQSNIVADSATDTLTFAAGSNVTLTTNASSDTVTIAAANDNTQLSNEQVQDIVGAMFSGNTETDITATYEDADGTIDLVVDLSSLNADNLDSGTIPNGRFPATLPVVSGANLTNLPAANLAGTVNIARIADNAVTFAKMQDVGTGVLIGRNDGGSGDMETLSASEVRTLLNVADGATAGITTAAENVQVTWSVTANGSSAYRFTGPGNDGSDDDPDLYLVRGQRYRFINNSGGAHPFQIRSSAGGSAYNTGVENNGANSGNIDFNVQHDAPTRLYYQCTSHGGMVGNIYITGGASWQTTVVNTSTTEEIFTLLNVGVGKNNPAYKLDVDGDAKVSGTLFLRDTAGQVGKIVCGGGDLDLYADGTIRFFESDANKEMIRFDINNTNDDGRMSFEGDTDTYFNHPGDNELGFTVGGTDTVRLKDGNLGVGDVTPEYRLKVYYDNNLADTIGSASTTARFTNRIGNLSNLSIYDRKHQITGNQTWYGTEKRIEYNVDDNTNKRMWISFYNYEDGVTDNTIRFGEGLDTEWMRIDNGDVGIGVTIPTEKLDVDGTAKATTFSGSGASLTNLNGSAITSGTVDAARVATLNQSTTGNAATATALQNARTIGGVSFDGTANINLPGVNASGNQDTSGTSAVATRVTVTNQTGDSSCNVLFAQSATGDQLPHTNANLTFNSTNGTLTATTFVGNLDLGSSNISSGTHTFTASAGSAVTADSTAVGNATAIEYTIFISNGSNIQSQKVLIMDNGTTAYSQEFAMMSNPNMIATFSADVNSGNVRLRATPESGISGSTTIKFTKMIIE